MKIILSLTLLLIISVSAIRVDPNYQYGQDIESEFKEWMMKYDKVYHEESEFFYRLSNYIKNMREIDELNALHSSAKFAPNKFSDLSYDEFKTTHLMPNFKPKTQRPLKQQSFDYPSNIPATLDWRQKGYVTPVKNQESCGSCWAFSATEQIETAWIMAGNSPQFLSEQQIVDCDPYDGGCGGGDPMTAYKSVQEEGGITTNASYPYTATNGQCMQNQTQKVVQISNYGYASSQGNETELKEALSARGPLSICVNAMPWMHYVSGVLNSNCSDELDHCVQMVGYDVDQSDPSNPIPYYIIRNSWGEGWGIDGYIHVGEGQNLCGITDEVTYVETTNPQQTHPRGYFHH